MKKLTGVVVVAAAAAALALVLSAQFSSATPAWSFPSGPPGSPHTPTYAEGALADASNVTQSSIRLAAQAGDLSLLSGVNAGGDVCLSVSVASGTIARDYECAPDLEGPLFYSVSTEGTPGATGSLKLAGIARNDVVLVKLLFEGGATQQLQLSTTRTFSYTDNAAPFPVKIQAFRAGSPSGPSTPEPVLITEESIDADPPEPEG